MHAPIMHVYYYVGNGRIDIMCIFCAFSGQDATFEYLFRKFAATKNAEVVIYINEISIHVNFFFNDAKTGGTNHPFK